MVYRHASEGQVEILIVGRRAPLLWALPKGTPEPGESAEQTALREVAEETGVKGAIVAPIGSIRYTFEAPRGRRRFNKTVHHFLMQPVGGDPSEHDAEYDVVRWATPEEALRLLTYQNERSIVRQAVNLLAQRDGL